MIDARCFAMLDRLCDQYRKIEEDPELSFAERLRHKNRWIEMYRLFLRFAKTLAELRALEVRPCPHQRLAARLQRKRTVIAAKIEASLESVKD